MNSPEADRLARVRLNQVAEPGHVGLARAVARFGAVRTAELLAGGVDSGVLRADDGLATRLQEADPEGVLARANGAGIRFVVPGDEEWPDPLDGLAGVGVKENGGVPLGLWVAGPLRLDDLAPSVAVVGSRSATTYGERVAEEFAADLVSHGVAVVSGAAFGIDVAAHRGALSASGTGASVAVLACGVDRDYPQAHAGLLAHLRRVGAVVSEAPPGGAPLRHRFLARNRIIAALTTATVVVEAAPRSGALNTANWARQLNRVLMGVPGPVTSVTSAGVHDLVRSGAAMLVTTGNDVRELVGPAGTHMAPVRA